MELIFEGSLRDKLSCRALSSLNEICVTTMSRFRISWTGILKSNQILEMWLVEHSCLYLFRQYRYASKPREQHSPLIINSNCGEESTGPQRPSRTDEHEYVYKLEYISSSAAFDQPMSKWSVITDSEKDTPHPVHDIKRRRRKPTKSAESESLPRKSTCTDVFRLYSEV